MWFKSEINKSHESPVSMGKGRSLVQRQRRLETRLCISVETLLRLSFGLEQIENKHAFPIPPTQTITILKHISLGTDLSEILELLETQNLVKTGSTGYQP